MSVSVMLGKKEARTVTILALMDILTQDLETKFDPKTRGHNAIVAIQEKVKKADQTIQGAVKDEFIDHCERFLAKVQLALDGFWGDVTEQDMLDIRKARESNGIAPEEDQNDQTTEDP